MENENLESSMPASPVSNPVPPSAPVENSVTKIKKFFSHPAYSVLALVVLVALVIAGGIFLRKPTTPAQFVLKAMTSDGAGIDPHSGFTLKSNQPLSSAQIQKILKFNPPIDFSVKDVSQNNLFVNHANAADSAAGSYTYELKPKDELRGDIVYQAVIDDKAYADREYGWAFQVKSTFQVIKTHPGNKTTGVPANTGIEMTFNRTGIQNIDQYFDITPKVDGRFETYDDTAVFLPKNPLAEHTIYTVTIKKGLKGQDSPDTLAADYQFSFETQSNYYQPPSYVSFTNDFVEAPPGIKTDLGVYSYNAANSALSVSVYRVTSPDEFFDSYQKSRTWSWGWASYYRQNNPTLFDTKGKTAVLTFKPNIVGQDYQNYMEIPQNLDRGMYVVDMTFNGTHEQVWLQITPTAHYFSISHDTSLMWLYDFTSKNPVKNAKVEFIQSGSPTLALQSSNNDGLSQFNTPNTLQAENTSDNYNPSFFKVTDADNNVTFVKIQDQWGYSGNRLASGDNYWKFISTDRYTYQMTDSVKFWGVIKARKEDVREKKVKVALYDSSRFWDYTAAFADQLPVAETEVSISPFNTIEGNLSFKGLDPKTYSMVVTLGDETVSQTSIEVLTYSKPSFQLGVSADKSAIFAGDSVTFTVKGSFYDGTPLADTELNYSGYWDSNITGTVKLDSNGEAKVKINLPYTEEENNYYPRGFNLSFTPASSEEGEIYASGDALVFGPHMYLQADQKSNSAENYTFSAKLNNIDITNQVPDPNGGFRTEYIAGPVANYPIMAKITKTWYEQVETGNYYDPIYKVVNKTYNYVRHDADVETINGSTDSKGEYSFTRQLAKADDTYYQVTFSIQDQQGRGAKSMVYAYYSTYDNWTPTGLSLNIGSESYQKVFSVNDPVNLSLTGNGNFKVPDLPILYYRYQNNISKAVVSKSTTYTENFGNDFLPSVQYRAVVLGPYGFVESNPVFAVFDTADANIKVNISTDKPSYRPGEKVTIKLHLTDKDGKSVAAETNVAVVDEAVFHVLPWNWQQQILDSLYTPIYTSPLTGYTVYLIPEAQAQSPGGGAEKGGCFTAGTLITLANGKTKPIEDIRVGDQILTFKDTNSRKLVATIVQGVSSHEVDDYLIINDSLQVTEEHKIFINGDWDFAGNAKVGDNLLLTNGRAETIETIVKKFAPHTLVYNIVVGTEHTYFADGYFVHNAEKGGDSVRDNFVDTASFQTLHTGTDGNAQMEFTTPDNITSWRVTARAFDNNSLKAGEDTKLVPATLPLFINAVTADSYLIGDSPQIKVGIYGTDYHPDQTTTVSATSPELKFNQNVTVSNHVGYINLDNLPEGSFDLTISAGQGSNKDALKRHVNVVKNYFIKPSVSTKVVSNGSPSIVGNQDGYTRLEFMDAGKGKFYQELLWNSYYGGIRADQITAGYYATGLLNSYFGAERPQSQLDLSPYQSGGIRLFTYGDVDLELSAKVADLGSEFVAANDLGDYFSESLHDTKTDLHRQAVSLYGLAALKKPVLTRLQDLLTVKELTWQDKIYVALGLAKLGATEQARVVYQQDIRPHLKFTSPQAWYEELTDTTQRVKLTDLTAVLAADLHLTDDANQLWNYMDTHAPEKDLDVLEKVMFMKAALPQATQAEAKFTYKANGKTEDVDLKNGQTHSVTLSSDELKNITFSNVTGNIEVSSFYEQSQDPATLTKDGNLALIRTYVVNGKATTEFKDGDIVRVKLFPKIAKPGLDSNYQIVDFLPSGLKPITDPYTIGGEQGYGCLWYPDKVVNNKLYFTVPKSFSSYSTCEPAIQYLARVVTKGSFTANPAIIQSTLNLNDLNISDSSKVNIK